MRVVLGLLASCIALPIAMAVATPAGSPPPTGPQGRLTRSAAKVAPATTSMAAESSWEAPVPEPIEVLRGFDPPANPYGAGHLGVDLAAAQSDVVVAAADGVVRFAGRVAGRPLVVLAHAGDLSTEYEPVLPSVATGQSVRKGEVIGHLSGSHAGCSGDCLHWGARRGAAYVDPLSLLRPLGPVRLLPCC